MVLRATRQFIALTAALIATLSFASVGQTGGPNTGSPPPELIATDQSIAQTVIQYPQLPRNFDPLSASSAQLTSNGLPPRPDPQRAPEAFRRWKKLMSLPRVTNGKVLQTKIYNGPIQQPSKVGILAQGAALSLTIPNWSGYAINSPPGTFTSNGSYVFAEWVVPIAQQPFGVCDGSYPYLSVQWIGFDGLTSTDVLQAGTEADAFCIGSTPTPLYSAWIEWYPFPLLRVSVPVAQPGDLMSGEVWYTTTPPFGHAIIGNQTLGQAQAYAFNPPAGTIFQGDSVEWIEERPGTEFGLANLPNYTADQFNYALSFNQTDFFAPGSSPANTITYSITMTCPPWTPTTSCPLETPISTPSLYGNGTMWFYPAFPAL